MKIKKTLAVISVIAAVAMGFTGCNKQEDNSSVSTNETEALSEPEKENAEPLENEVIRFMSDYDLNPSNGGSRSIALTLFEDLYGGKIEWVPTTRKTMYDDLSKAVLGGEKIDMFPYMDNAVPYGVSKDYFEPVDDYLDLNDDIWSGIKGLADKMSYGGKHYAVPTGINDPVVLIYSRKAVENIGFDDPYKLYNEGKWDWDTFIKMMKEFDETGCAGFIGQGIIQSTGQPYVNYDGNNFTSNLENEDIKKAGEIVEQISGVMYDDAWYDTLDENILFLGMGSWAIPQSNKSNKDADVFFVPFPSSDGKGKNITAEINSKLLVKGSDKGEAVAAYLKCERIAATEEKYVKAQKDAAVKNGFTEEQYDFLEEIKNPDNIVFDFSYGMSKKISNNIVDFKERGAVNNINDAILSDYSDAPESWAKIRDSFKKVIESEISEYK